MMGCWQLGHTVILLAEVVGNAEDVLPIGAAERDTSTAPQFSQISSVAAMG
jgi:hypothetical protein